jgi:hypothetical protein
MCTVKIAIAILSLAAVAAQSPTDKPVRVIEDGILDEIQLFVDKLPEPYKRVSIQPFETGAADLGTGGKDGDPDEQEEARLMQREAPGLLVEALTQELRARHTFEPLTTAGESDLVITGRFYELNPGSRKKRYWVGFGAGKAAVGVAGEIKDRSGRLLANFRQRRIATGGWGGGDSIKKMRSDSRSIGKDLANFLHTWAAGKRLD